MKYKFLLITVLSLFCFSCKKENPKQTEHILSIGHETNSKIKLSEFISEIKVIPLETSDDCLIGNILKVQLFDDKIYALDLITHSLFIFDANGKYVNQLNKKGQGPGEYITLFDFSVNEKGIYALDISSHRINHYGFDLNFIDATSFHAFSTGFLIDGKQGFWLYNDPTYQPDDYRLFKIDEMGNITERFFPRKTEQDKLYFPYLNTNVFHKHGADLYFSPRFGNTIYKLFENEWKAEIQLQFGDKTYPGPSDMDLTEDDVYSGHYIFRNNFLVLDDYIFVSYVANEQGYFAFYNKHSRQIASGRVENDLLPDCNSFYPRCADDNYLIEFSEAGDLLKFYPGLKAVAPDLQPDDNPVVILYKLKRPV